ncbi:MAG: hypothetical protein LKG25_07370 [Prevotella sp.]|jgi:hypothetical protein|nr:hypothetical protein [Prevotella sp.]MCI1282400.1 hypothetical protein [Prevotella sp.]
MKKIILALLLVTLCLPTMAKKNNDNRVVFIMVDGLRWEEIFNGIDSICLNNKKYVSDIAEKQKLYWRATPEERRAALFPFIWGEVSKMGILYGNRNKGSFMNVANGMHFSYPGYNETTTGYPDDKNVNSNDAFPNPNVSILEAANKDPRYQGKVLAFGSWNRFHEIFNQDRSGIPVNAGWDASKNPNATAAEKDYDDIAREIPRQWPTLRYDVFTYRYALEAMKTCHPVLTFVGFGETDDFAHISKYGLYIDSANRFDRFMKDLWEYTQSDPFYKDKTTFIVTCDHGRGNNDPGWKSHGNKVPGASETWMIAFGNQVKAKGEIEGGKQIYNKQVAFTVAKLLDIDFKNTEGNREEPIDLK